MDKYKLCNKCGLNYVLKSGMQFCEICLGKACIADRLAEEENEELEELYSPFLQSEQKLETQIEEERLEDEDDDHATWRGYVEIDDDFNLPDFSSDDDETEDEEEEQEETVEEADDFEYVSLDDYDFDEDDEQDDDDELDD